jgi:hypothetical protein
MFAIAGVDGLDTIDANDNETGKYNEEDDNNEDIIAVASIQQANAPHEPQPIIKVHNNDSINNNIANDYANGYDDDDNNDDNSVASINVNPKTLAIAAMSEVTDKLDKDKVSGVQIQG